MHWKRGGVREKRQARTRNENTASKNAQSCGGRNTQIEDPMKLVDHTQDCLVLKDSSRLRIMK